MSENIDEKIIEGFMKAEIFDSINGSKIFMSEHSAEVCLSLAKSYFHLKINEEGGDIPDFEDFNLIVEQYIKKWEGIEIKPHMLKTAFLNSLYSVREKCLIILTKNTKPHGKKFF